MSQFTRRQFTSLGVASAAIGLTGTASVFAAGTSHDYGAGHLDWYRARTSSTRAPILVYVHGGAWALGNRGQVNAKPDHFTKDGYHFVSVGYTLFPAANAQTQALQIGQAVNWVYNNAARFGADPERIALMGHSAGCHLSTLATFTGAAPPVKALVCNDTRAYDLPFLAEMNGGALPFLYKAPFTRRSMWDAWSPISYTGLQQQPPTLVAWSGGHGRDRVSKRFADTLEQDGTEVHRFDGKSRYSHLSIDRRIGRNRDKLTDAIDVFLSEKLSV